MKYLNIYIFTNFNHCFFYGFNKITILLNLILKSSFATSFWLSTEKNNSIRTKKVIINHDKIEKLIKKLARYKKIKNLAKIKILKKLSFLISNIR